MTNKEMAEMFVLDFAERWDMTEFILERYENDLDAAQARGRAEERKRIMSELDYLRETVHQPQTNAWMLGWMTAIEEAKKRTAEAIEDGK